MDPERFRYFVNTQQASLEDRRVEGKSLGSQKLVVFWEDIEPRNRTKSYDARRYIAHNISRISCENNNAASAV